MLVHFSFVNQGLTSLSINFFIPELFHQSFISFHLEMHIEETVFQSNVNPSFIDSIEPDCGTIAR